MRTDRVRKVLAELQRTTEAVKALETAAAVDGETSSHYRYAPKESGALRRASLDLTRALAEMRKSDYN